MLFRSHVFLYNSAHESVGGLPTVAGNISLPDIAKYCGYVQVFSVEDYYSLDLALKNASVSECLTFIEAKCRIGARDDLGRPKTSALENKNAFMEYITHH